MSDAQNIHKEFEFLPVKQVTKKSSVSIRIILIVVMIVVIVSSFTIMVFVIVLVFVASLDFGYLVALRQYLELPKEKVKKQKSRFQSLYAQGSSSHIFGTLGIPATSGLAIGLAAGVLKSVVFYIYSIKRLNLGIY